MTGGQQEAIDQLKAVEAIDHGDTLEILEIDPPNDSGWIVAYLSIDCSRYDTTPAGLPLRRRERFRIWIPPGFPYAVPKVRTPHARFAGFPHVQWRRQFCLYQSRESEWVPKDGIFGFLQRLHEWLEAGARGSWEGEGDPLHPPVDYSGSSDQLIIPKSNTPEFDSPAWIGLASMDRVSDLRADLVGWNKLSEIPADEFVAPAVLLKSEFPFEYPQTIGELLSELTRAGVRKKLVLALLKCAVILNGDDNPIFFVVGTPMRGVVGEERKQHLAVWKIPAGVAELVALTASEKSDTDELTEVRNDLAEALLKAIQDKRPTWCHVREARPEILTRRDHDSPMKWFRNRTVSLWGCGAIGGHVAIMLARAGVQHLVLRDRGDVAPGLLERQPFSDADLGESKVDALKKKLLAIDPALSVEASSNNLLSEPLGDDDWCDGSDVVIDATANRIVRQKLEEVRAASLVDAVPILALMIDSSAERGVVAVAQRGYSGGPADLFRKAKIRLARRPSGEEWFRAFWPADDPGLFQPEPGCSSPTFVGSAADSMALAGSLLNVGASELESTANDTGSTSFTMAPHAGCQTRKIRFIWQPDIILKDVRCGYQVRLSRSAWRSIRGWVQKQHRAGDEEIETGGVLFGERNDAAKVLFVNDVIGPPPDSTASREEFVCGTSGVQATNDRKRGASNRSVAFVGMWHTHPDVRPFPSHRDVQGMAKILDAAEPTPRRALLLIVGTNSTAGDIEDVAAFVFDRDRLLNRTAAEPSGVGAETGTPVGKEETTPGRRIGLALSGGGSRAAAFHLGCLRALEDLGLLSEIQVMSAVSGGSVIAGMYAYSDDSFPAFDERVTELLRRGLHRPTLREAIRPGLLAKTARTAMGSGMLAMGLSALNGAARAIHVLGASNFELHQHFQPLDRAVSRRWSRTDAFEATVRKLAVGDHVLPSVERADLEVVFNATELRTQSAFRFGSGKSGSWRFGELAENDSISVAHAIAASTAYPALLPAVDQEYRVKKNRNTSTERFILSDGGIYDNLGVRCLEPGRNPDVSIHVFDLSLLICCDAGPGLPAGDATPFWWPSRMTRSVLASLRQVQRATQNRLHAYLVNGMLDGFLYPYLGMRDENLPYRPPDLISRDDVSSYPTDFGPMDAKWIQRLADRGEVLTRVLVDHYAP
jgi:integrative and conjugative element protein (TIGR02256 family)